MSERREGRKNKWVGEVAHIIIPALRMLKQEDHCRFKVSLGYRIRTYLRKWGVDGAWNIAELVEC